MVATAILVVVIVSIIMTAAVLLLNAKAFRKMAPGEQRLQPAHVVAVSIAHLGYVTLASLYVLAFPSIWTITLYFVASLLTIVALVIVGDLQRRRIGSRKTAS